MLVLVFTPQMYVKLSTAQNFWSQKLIFIQLYIYILPYPVYFSMKML